MRTRRDYFKAGEKHKSYVEEHATDVNWYPYKEGVSLPFFQGYAIKAVVKEFKFKAVMSVGYAPGHPIIAIKNRFRNALVSMYFYDDGTRLSPVFANVEEVERVDPDNTGRRKR